MDDTLGHKKLAKLLGVGKHKVRRVMKKYGIEARRKKKKYHYHGTASRKYPNLANDKDEIGKYDGIFFSDIFEFKIRDGSIVRGCFAERKSTRQVLSLVFSYRLGAELVEAALKEAEVLKIDTYIWHSASSDRRVGSRQTVWS